MHPPEQHNMEPDLALKRVCEKNPGKKALIDDAIQVFVTVLRNMIAQMSRDNPETRDRKIAQLRRRIIGLPTRLSINNQSKLSAALMGTIGGVLGGLISRAFIPIIDIVVGGLVGGIMGDMMARMVRRRMSENIFLHGKSVAMAFERMAEVVEGRRIIAAAEHYLRDIEDNSVPNESDLLLKNADNAARNCHAAVHAAHRSFVWKLKFTFLVVGAISALTAKAAIATVIHRRKK
eukprot:TRINITY_DN4272_c0_g1_i1.p1 TRINITY_DN4272_c0_g1~~TRINITY_DN4272_c0_g1_i1.p1  ORF type:complete len:234 (-),score=10.46 TRINITY_DN4272_c0_g1_i1:1017-1718(-)